MKNIIIITGVSSGIGQEFALQMDTAFSNIDEFWLIARREDRLLEVAQVMEHATRLITMDVTDEYGAGKQDYPNGFLCRISATARFCGICGDEVLCAQSVKGFKRGVAIQGHLCDRCLPRSGLHGIF